MMRVMFIAPYDLTKRNGTTIRVYNLLKAASFFSDTIYLVSPNVNEDLKAISKLTWIKIPQLRFNKLHFFASVNPVLLQYYIEKYKVSIFQYLIIDKKIDLKNNVDIIHIHWLYSIPLSSLLRSLWQTKTPVFVDLHGSYALQPTMPGDVKSLLIKMKSRLYEFFALRYKYLHAHGVIGITVPSEAFRKFLIHKYRLPENYVHVVPDAVDEDVISKYLEYTSSKIIKLEELGINLSKVKIVAYSGSISFYHGFHDLLIAFKLVKRRVKNVKLLLIVPNASIARSTIYRFRVNPSDVIIIENVPRYELIAYLKFADVVVLPHRLNSQFKYLYSNKLLDYMMSGRPIVAYALPSIKKFLERYPCKLLIKPDDPVELAKGILNIFSRYDHLRDGMKGEIYNIIPTLRDVSVILKRIYSMAIKHS